MKICITSQGNTLESQIDPRFGRCAYFIIIDPDSLEFEVIENINAQSMGGAGIQSGQLISEKGVTALITGNVGPNAFQTLQASGIEIITGVSGIVREAAEKYQTGDFSPTKDATVGPHHGSNKGK